MTKRARESAGKLACELAEHDAGPLSPAERAAVAAFVAARLARAPAHVRLGIEVPSALLTLAGRRWVAARLATTRAPLFADLAKALRQLAIVRLYAGRGSAGA